MDINAFLSEPLFPDSFLPATGGQLLLFLLAIVVLAAVWRFFLGRVFPWYFQKEEIQEADQKKIRRIFRMTLALALILLALFTLGLDRELTLDGEGNIAFGLSTLLTVLIVWQLARMANLLFSDVLLQKYYTRRDEQRKEEAMIQQDALKTANRLVQYIVYAVALLLIMNAFEFNPELPTIKYKNTEIPIRVSNIIIAFLVILIARLINWMLVNLFLYRYYKRKEVNIGSQHAINQLLQYVIFIIAIFIALDRIGVNLTLVWAGAGALLIGVGIGLQQTVSDFFSGLLLLFERSVEVGDVLEVEGLIGTVKKIGLRSSQIQTRANITVIIPNSKLTSEKVINWSHFDKRARFSISVGVAYGSDTQLVKELLIKVANAHKHVIKYPPPFVRFTNFGDSSLDFELLFWSREFMRIEDVKSDLRFEVDQSFRENGVTIPFPQRDVWMRGE
jgi:small-conductance mechanosensitive channel